ncbi:MAG: GNAT family N-acetyltransferase [Chloroflexi bacterium]|nr:GNAT family N-acetyltransferase [Chloroflexota bacterium]
MIESCTADDIQEQHAALIALLQDAVNGGASVSFIAPLDYDTAADYWAKVAAEIALGQRVLLLAFDGEQLVGSVQLALAGQPNARHRAEVQKLLVYSASRRQGIGKALMEALEQAAQSLGRTLLVLDTQRSSPAEKLYTALNYTRVGVIPEFALSSTGTLEDTVIFYKMLD